LKKEAVCLFETLVPIQQARQQTKKDCLTLEDGPDRQPRKVSN